ncbi:MAG TPA: transposase [Cyanobacteria bacterium UBA11369]|nr:transposase [Cyanobacteria bacterium UBA11371]HBE31228.1 transposase [Cyanobacteria bacterium UBA11368]HBE49096.1 transposase [Cyanobacteria bacterium UBA11369]
MSCDRAPDAWVKWVTQRSDVVARRIVASEFQWISRDTDVLLEAYDPEIGKFLILNELQLRYSAQMPRRMRAYAALAEERYSLPVYPVLINILPPSPTVVIATAYESEVLGLRALQQYRVINLWEIDAQIVFQQQLTSLLPFIPVLKNGGEESVVRQAVQLLRTDEQLSELEPLLAFFASFVLSSRLVQQIMRWDMAVLLESPWYQEILNKGRQEGLQEGRQEGLREGLLAAIELGLELKFGSSGLELMPEISQIQDVDVLRAIQEALRIINSLDELREIYRVSEA